MLNDQYHVHMQHNRVLKVRLDLLNWEEHKIEELQGDLISGGYSIDRNSASRRTCNLTFVIKNKSYIPSFEGFVWLNRKFKLFIGIKDLRDDSFVWFDKGLFVMNNPDLTIDNNSLTMSLQGYDKMALYDGTLGGTLSHFTRIPEGKDINVALRETLSDLGGEEKFNMDVIDRDLPYTIEYDAGSTIYDILQEIANLYMDWSQIYFNTDGYFVFTKDRERTQDPIIWDFSDKPFTLSYTNSPDFENIKNHIQVWGRLLDNGTQIKTTLINDDPENDFSTVNIGEKILVIDEDTIFTQEQSDVRAEWELLNHSHLNEQIGINCVPIYMLDVNNVVYVEQEEVGIKDRYIIEKIDCGLEIGSTMSIGAFKVYEIVGE